MTHHRYSYRIFIRVLAAIGPRSIVTNLTYFHSYSTPWLSGFSFYTVRENGNGNYYYMKLRTFSPYIRKDVQIFFAFNQLIFISLLCCREPVVLYLELLDFDFTGREVFSTCSRYLVLYTGPPSEFFSQHL